MRQLYFADSWFFIALLDRFDAHHFRARTLRERLRGSVLVTHDAVLTEVLAFFSREGAGSRLRAVALIRGLTAGKAEVVAASGLFAAGVDLYGRRPDKEYSLVDCISMELMRRRGITHVLTNDHHFRQEGFTVVSDAQ